MKLIKHDVKENPPKNKPLLIVYEDFFGKEEWATAFWDGVIWRFIGPSFAILVNPVIEWYELPERILIKNNFSQHQKELEEFWDVE